MAARDPVDPARSAQMALMRSRDTKPEMRVRKVLHASGLRYRLHDRRLPGAPDLVFPGRRLVLFVHGCFWHQHPGCAGARMPKSRLDFGGRNSRAISSAIAGKSPSWRPGLVGNGGMGVSD